MSNRHIHHDWKRDLERSELANTKLGRQLAEQFSKNLTGTTSSSRTTDSPISFKTQEEKCKALINAVLSLKSLSKNAIRTLWQIEPLHIEALCQQWIAAGNSIGNIENKLSHMRSLAKWIGKKEMVPDTDDIEALVSVERRSGIAKIDKSWEGNEIDVGQKIEDAMKIDPHVGVQLLLQIALGVRKQESFLFRPKAPIIQTENGRKVLVEDGTKGGLAREVPLTSPAQEAVIDFARVYANSKSGTTIPLNFTFDQWDNHYCYIMKKLGITKKGAGVTSHGLRHQNLQGLYKQITGKDAPVKSLANGLTTNPDNHDQARQIVALTAGHSKLSKSNAYIGSNSDVGGKRKSKKELVPDDMILAMIKQCGGNKKLAAETLGISRPYIYKRLDLILDAESKRQAMINP